MESRNGVQGRSLSTPPLYIWIDPTSSCNLACHYCYTKHSHGRTHMTPELFASVLRWLAPVRSAIQVVHLNWRGEPLMNPRFDEILSLYSQGWQDIPMHWHTNGTLLTRKRAQNIVSSSAPHRMFVSIDGGTQESHERNRGEGTFRSALTGLRNLIEINGSQGPLSVGLYQIDFGIPPSAYDAEFAELAKQVTEWVRLPPLELDGSEGTTPESHDRACFWAGHALCIDPVGEVSICLLSRGKQGTIGNVLDSSAAEVIERASAWRRAMTEHGRGSNPHCADCKKRNGVPAVSQERIAIP